MIRAPYPASISPFSAVESIGVKLVSMNIGLTTITSTVYPTANMAVFYPFVLTRRFKVAQVYWYNGSTVNGNVDVGVYSADGTRLLSCGSTAQAGTDVMQAVDITDTFIGPGLFRCALASNSGTATFIAAALGLLGFCSAVGVKAQASAFALPATATIATPTADYLPYFGITGRSVL